MSRKCVLLMYILPVIFFMEVVDLHTQGCDAVLTRLNKLEIPIGEVEAINQAESKTAQILFAQYQPKSTDFNFDKYIASVKMRLDQSTKMETWKPDLSKLKGLDFEMAYISDFFSNVSGGIKRKAGYLDNVDFVLDVDLETSTGWIGAKANLHIIGDNGVDPTAFVGDLQGTSNIESPDTWKIYEAWIQQNLFEDKFSLLAGLYDLNSEFDVIETAGLFINSSFGIGPEFSQSGQNGPSIFPTTSLGFRARYYPSKFTYLQAVILDGVPGNPNNPRGTRIIWNRKEGYLLSTEMGFNTDKENSSQRYSKVAVGTWRYTANFGSYLGAEATGDPVKSASNEGIYLLTEQELYRFHGNPEKNISLFCQYGYANGDINQFDYYIGGGVVFGGLLFGRTEDQLGLAFANAHNSSKFIQYMHSFGIESDASELAIELTYHTQIFPWLAMQPDIQYIVNPGTDPSLDNALFLNSRFEVSF